MADIKFRISVQTEQASLYFETLPSLPVPRVGEDVFVSGARAGDGFGWWTVRSVSWILPSIGAMEPTMEAILTVEWAAANDRPAPTHDEDRGWVRDE